MKRFYFLIMVVILFFATVAKASEHEKIEWQTDLKKASTMAKEKWAPMMLDFWASWCDPCKKMDLKVWPDKGLVAQSRRFICLSIDHDFEKKIVFKYKVRVLPTIIIADPIGNEIIRFEGYTRASSLTKVMKMIPSDYSPAKRWLLLLEQESKNVKALIGLGNFYHKAGRSLMSNRIYKEALKTKEVKNNLLMQEEIMVAVGLNHLYLRKYKKASKLYKKCLKKFPEGAHRDMILFGLITAELRLSRISEAEKNFQQLKSLYPHSRAAKQARENIQATKNAAKKQKK